MEQVTKKCRECGRTREISFFRKKKGSFHLDCQECYVLKHRERRHLYFINNREKHYAGMERCKIKNPEKYRLIAQKSKIKNAEKGRIRSRLWKSKNPKMLYEYRKKWNSENPSKVLAHVRFQRIHKQKRTVIWADNKKIRIFYWMANRMSKVIGVKYHVDHIVPLKGENVSGLHHENNLQVMRWDDNLRKSNKFTTI